MDQIAFYTDSMSVTWHGLIMAAAIVSAVILSVMLCRAAGLPCLAMLATAAGSLIISPLFSRLLYWYSFSEQYESLSEALFSFSNTGQSLLGAIMGVLLSAFAVSKILRVDWLSLMDCAAPAGALGIAVGRLASAFTAADYGWITFDSPSQQRFPISLAVPEAGSGTIVWRFPTFAYESFAAAAVCALLLVMFARRSGPDARVSGRGSVMMMFTVMFSATQFVFESTRYDKLTFPFNGFVSILQIACGAVGIGAALAFFAVRAGKAAAMKPYLLWTLIAASVSLLAVSGIMEYEVQRHIKQYYIYYPPMMLSMLAIAAVAYVLCRAGEEAPEDNA